MRETTMWLVVWFLQSTALLGVAGVCSHLALSARVRRTLWLAAIAGSAILLTQPLWVPALTWLGWAAAAEQASALTFDVPLVLDARAAVPSSGVPDLLFAAWVSVAAILLCRQALAHLRVWRFVRQCATPPTALGARLKHLIGADATRVRVLPTDRHGPFTAGVLRSRVYLPAGADAWGDEQLGAVLTHELAHVSHRDCLAQLFADLHAAVAWPNPAAWWARSALARERELIADEHVLSQGMRSDAYADVLVRLSTRHAWLPAAAMAKPSSLAQRIETMLQPRVAVPRWRIALVATLFASSALAIACADSKSVDAARFAQGEVEGPDTIDYRPADETANVPDLPPEGSLDPELIKNVVASGREGFRACYEAELDRDDTLPPMRVVVHFTIGVDGTPRDISSNHFDAAPTLAPCLQRAMGALHFPKPAGGGVVVVNYPFEFAHGGADKERTSKPAPGELTREQVLDVMMPLRRSVNRCFDGFGEGKVILKFVITPSGKAQAIEVNQTFAALTEKSAVSASGCMRDALSKLDFPKAQHSTPVTFPFLLNE